MLNSEGITQEKSAQPSGGDFFSSLGSEQKRKDPNDKPDPSQLRVYKNELNTQLLEGKSVDEYETKGDIW